MSRIEKTREKILLGNSDANVDFAEMCSLLLGLGFSERVKGSHHIFTRDNIEEIINIQPKGSKAKPYQVKLIRNIILKYRLGVYDE
jgi:predicted RNA binding protein YcfA (HicA-like mRNA interferase family)